MIDLFLSLVYAILILLLVIYFYIDYNMVDWTNYCKKKTKQIYYNTIVIIQIILQSLSNLYVGKKGFEFLRIMFLKLNKMTKSII